MQEIIAESVYMWDSENWAALWFKERQYQVLAFSDEVAALCTDAALDVFKKARSIS